jgi:DNA repair exonuclease SbcCD nuclease subunit
VDASVRFIHAADLHMQSPFVGLSATLPAHVADELVKAPYRAWDSIVELAISESANAVLVAGDVYDDADRSLRAQRHFVSGLMRLHEAGIASLVICGNHDPLDGWDAGLTFPDSCHRFGPEVSRAPLIPSEPDRASVYGASFAKASCPQNLVRQVPRIAPGELAIGLMHCAVGEDSDQADYAPCTVTDLRRSGVAYWALGHVHRRRVVIEKDPLAIYPGCPQGLRWSQTGPKGVYVVEIDQAGTASAVFSTTDHVRLEVLEVDIVEIESASQLLDEICNVMQVAANQAAGRPLICRVVLRGRGRLDGQLRRSDILGDALDELRDQFRADPLVWCDRIDVATGGEFDRASRLAGTDFVADLLRLCDEYTGGRAELPEFETAVRALHEHRSYKRLLNLAGPPDMSAAELVNAAENLALDHLEG